MGKVDRNWVKKGLTSLDKELGVHSEGDGKPFQGFESGEFMARLMFYKVTPVATWKVDKGKARLETKRPIRKS